MKKLAITAVTAVVLLVSCSSSSTDTAPPDTDAVETTTTVEVASTTAGATLRPEAVDAIYHANIAPAVDGWDRIGSRLRHCVTFPEQCDDTIDDLVGSVTRKALRINDAVLAADAEAGGADPTRQVEESATGLLLGLTFAVQGVNALEDCDWPYFDGGDCEEAWGEMLGAVTAATVLSADWQ